ncbi:MAG: hypothetical protein H6814_00555 [Phycisphaeraceae bacterium]|nr:hypothetical protein [Phycisphaeraceae bacterium]
MIRKTLLFGLAALAAHSPALAQTVWNGELSEESFQVTTSAEDPGEYTDTATISVASFGTFSFDFSAAGDTEFSFTWAAPPGQFIEIAVPGDAISTAILRLRFTCSPGGTISETDAVTYEVFGASGSPLPAADLSPMNAYGNGLRTMIVWNNLPAGETYRFQSVTGTATVSAGVNDNVMNSPILEFDIQGSVRLLGDGTNPVGQWISLVPALSGDLNGDCVVDTADLGILLGAFGTSDPLSDLNNDGVVDTADLGILLGQFGMSCVSE